MDSYLLQEAQRIITELNLRHYSHTPPEDVTLMHWWMTLAQSGDLNRAIMPQSQRAGAFLSLFQRDNILVYALDSSDAVWFAFWFEPAFGSRAAWLSNWCSPHRRGTKSQLSATWAMHIYLLSAFPHLFALTRQEALLDNFTGLGYNILGKFDKLFDESSDAWVAHLTAPAFLASRFHKLRSTSWEAQQKAAAETAAARL